MRHKVSFILTLPVSYQHAHRPAFPGVTPSCHCTWFGGIYQDPKNFFGTFPVDPERFLAMYPEYRPARRSEAGVAEDPHRRDRRPQRRPTASTGRSAIASRSPRPIWRAQERQAPGSSRSSASMTARRKAPTPPLSFSATITSTKAARAARDWSAGISVRVKDPDAGRRDRRSDRRRNSPTRRYETKAEPEGAFAAGLRPADRRHRHDPDRDARRGVFHHPARRRQHHGPVRARADRGARRAQGDGFHQ